VIPRPPAVPGAEHAPLAVRPPRVAEGGDVDEVRIIRMHADAPDVAGVAEPHVGPAAAGVGGAVHAVAVRHVAANARLAGAGVDHVGIGGRDGHRADGGRLEEAVGDVLPVGAAVGRLPDAARAGAEVEDHGLDGIAGDGHRPAAAVGAHETPLKRVEETGIDAHWAGPWVRVALGSPRLPRGGLDCSRVRGHVAPPARREGRAESRCRPASRGCSPPGLRGCLSDWRRPARSSALASFIVTISAHGHHRLSSLSDLRESTATKTASLTRSAALLSGFLTVESRRLSVRQGLSLAMPRLVCCPRPSTDQLGAQNVEKTYNRAEPEGAMLAKPSSARDCVAVASCLHNSDLYCLGRDSQGSYCTPGKGRSWRS
jgi:hypothetical protein